VHAFGWRVQQPFCTVQLARNGCPAAMRQAAVSCGVGAACPPVLLRSARRRVCVQARARERAVALRACEPVTNGQVSNLHSHGA
jgi:hypothetical protein